MIGHRSRSLSLEDDSLPVAKARLLPFTLRRALPSVRLEGFGTRASLGLVQVPRPLRRCSGQASRRGCSEAPAPQAERTTECPIELLAVAKEAASRHSRHSCLP